MTEASLWMELDDLTIPITLGYLFFRDIVGARATLLSMLITNANTGINHAQTPSRCNHPDPPNPKECIPIILFFEFVLPLDQFQTPIRDFAP